MSVNKSTYKKTRRLTVVRISNLQQLTVVDSEHLLVIEDDSGNIYKITVGSLLSQIQGLQIVTDESLSGTGTVESPLKIEKVSGGVFHP